MTLRRWGDPRAPCEKAMIARSVETSIHGADVTCALRSQESATSLIGPNGDCLASVPYGHEQVLVYTLDLAQATGLSAQRFNPAFSPRSRRAAAAGATRRAR
jgi:hypothetical protein